MIEKLVRTAVVAALAASVSLYFTARGGDLAPEERARIVERVASEIERGYAIAEKSGELAQKLRERAKGGAYERFDDGAAFAKKLTLDLRADSNDKHFHLEWKGGAEPRNQSLRGHRDNPDERLAYWKARNFGFERAERLEGNVGYVEVRGFPGPEMIRATVASAMTFLANTDALIIDLRRNGGGTPGGVRLLASYLFDTKPVLLNTMHHRTSGEVEEWWTLESVDGPRYVDKPVYVLTSSHTGSAAEEFAYDVQAPKRATIVGATTAGAGHACVDVEVGEHATLLLPATRPINPITKTGWEGVGVKPDVEVAADEALQTAHELALEALISRSKDEQRKHEVEMALEAVRTKSASAESASRR